MLLVVTGSIAAIALAFWLYFAISRRLDMMERFHKRPFHVWAFWEWIVPRR